MKAAAILVILATTTLLLVRYRIERDFKFLFIAIVVFAFLVSCAAVTPMLRPVLPLFFAHIATLFVGWIGLVYYLLRKRFSIWLIAAPAATLGIFLILSLIEGARYEDIWFG